MAGKPQGPSGCFHADAGSPGTRPHPVTHPAAAQREPARPPTPWGPAPELAQADPQPDAVQQPLHGHVDDRGFAEIWISASLVCSDCLVIHLEEEVTCP